MGHKEAQAERENRVTRVPQERTAVPGPRGQMGLLVHLELEDLLALNHQKVRLETPDRQATLGPRVCPERGEPKDPREK